MCGEPTKSRGSPPEPISENPTRPIPSHATFAGVELHVSLVGRKDITSEIYRQIRGAVVSGRLRPGDPLPPSRELARRLSVSRTTVMVAYERLNGEGFVTSRVGAGTFVSDHVPGHPGPSTRVASVLQPRDIWKTIPLPTVFAAKAAFDFRTGLPDTTLFPYETWRPLLARELRASAGGCGAYGDPAGDHGLRDAIARHIATSRGVAATADDVIITNGTQQALDLVARVLLAPGDRVAVEDPGYPTTVAPVRVPRSPRQRDSGRPPGPGRRCATSHHPPRLRTPSHQYPLGSSMSLARRTALLAWAERNDAAIVEDDYDSEFRFSGRPIEPLQTLDSSGRVIYVGSFSKTLLPTLRLGFVVVPPDAPGGDPGRQVRDGLAHAPAHPKGTGPLHRPGQLRTSPPQDAQHLPGTARTNHERPRRGPRRAPHCDPFRGRPPHRRGSHQRVARPDRRRGRTGHGRWSGRRHPRLVLLRPTSPDPASSSATAPYPSPTSTKAYTGCGDASTPGTCTPTGDRGLSDVPFVSSAARRR